MSVEGDYHKLDGLIDTLKHHGEWVNEAIDLLGAESTRLVQEGFTGEHDPYGTDWQPLRSWTGVQANISARVAGGLKLRKVDLRGMSKILQQTGRLRGSFVAHRSGHTLILMTPVVYAGYHQQQDGPGKGIIPRRMMIPQRGELPRAWEEAYRHTLDDFIRKKLAA